MDMDSEQSFRVSSDDEDDDEIDGPRSVSAYLTWRGQQLPLYEGENIIGREEVCEVRIDQSSISSKHAEIIVRNGGATVRDLRSINGTFVEKKPLSGKFKRLKVSKNSMGIEEGSRIRLGMVTCSFSFAPRDLPQSYDSASTIAQNAHPTASFQSETQIMPADRLGSETPTGETDDEPIQEVRDDVTESGSDAEIVTPAARIEEYDLVSTNRVIITAHSTAHIMASGSLDMPTQVDKEMPHSMDEDDDSVVSQDLMDPIDDTDAGAVGAARLPGGVLALDTPQATDTPRPPLTGETVTPAVSVASISQAVSIEKIKSERTKDISLDDQSFTPNTLQTSVQIEYDTKPRDQLQTPVAADHTNGPSSAIGIASDEPIKKTIQATVLASRKVLSGIKRVAQSKSKLLEDSDEEIEKVHEKPVIPSSAERDELRDSDEDGSTPAKLPPTGRRKGLANSSSTTARRSSNRIRDNSEADEEVARNTAINAFIGTPAEAPKAVDEMNDLVDTPANEEPAARKKKSPVRFVDAESSLSDQATAVDGSVKNPMEEEINTATNAVETKKSKQKAATEEVPKPKGRGRRQASVQAIPEPSLEPAEQGGEMEVIEEVPMKATKGRGRKRDLTSVSIPDSSTEKPTDAEIPVEATTAGPAPKRGRGIQGRSNQAQSSEPVKGEAPPCENVLVCFTRVEETSHSKILKKLTAVENPKFTITADPTVASHCVTTNDLKRTPKLMTALNSGVRFVVHEGWLSECGKRGCVVPVVTWKFGDLGTHLRAIMETNSSSESVIDNAFHDVLKEMEESLLESPYIVRDLEKEDKWGFNMATTLARTTLLHYWRESHPQAGPSGVFAGYAVFVTPGVCGKWAPETDEMRQIVESGGGRWLSDASEVIAIYAGTGSSTSRGKSKSGAQSESTESGTLPSLVVVSAEEVVKKELSKDVLAAAKRSGAAGIYAVEALFQAALKQRLDLSAHLLSNFRFR